MKTLRISLILFSIILLISCSKNDEYSSFKGNWRGKLYGDINGTWTGNISAKNKFNGNVNATGFNSRIWEIDVSEGGELFQKEQVAIDQGAIIFYGNFTNNSGSGTWSFPRGNIEGTWEGTR